MSADTIFALSSGAPPAAIAVVRVSGPGAEQSLRILAGHLPRPRMATLRTIVSAGVEIDSALLLWFPGTASATGEPLAEFHLHGGTATIRRLLDALGALPGLRPALPGEFTRRALLNGKLSLAQAEALGDLLAAETERERRTAMAGLGGALDAQVERWRMRLLALCAGFEALLDYDDEADVAERNDEAAARLEVAQLREEFTALGGVTSEELRDGMRVVLAGPPNSGKSSLMNALVGRDAALVSAQAGTTRDLIEARLEIAGRRVRLIDTAGVRDAEDEIERAGVQRARAAAEAADLVLWLGDEPPPTAAHAVPLHARCDMPGREAAFGRLAVSARTGAGLDALRALLADFGAGEPEIVLTGRQRSALLRLEQELRFALEENELVLTADHLRRALRELDVLTGQAGHEHILDDLFARFCIGK